MQTINALLGFPNGTPIDAITARISKVYKRKEINTTYGPKTIQDGYFEDGAGAKIKFKAWSHPDLEPLQGKEFVIHADGKGKGLTVKIDSYNKQDGSPVKETILEVGKSGQFQHVAVYHANAGTTGPVSAQEVAKPQPVMASAPKATGGVPVVSYQAKPSTVHGATAGLATNKAVEILIESGAIAESMKNHTLENDIVSIGGQIVRAALRLESGDLGEAQKPVSAPAPVATKEELAEEIPF